MTTDAGTAGHGSPSPFDIHNTLVAAGPAFKSGLRSTDMWLVRLNLGQAYLQAGYHAEAMSEFEICQKQLGEVTALFLDDIPTFHYSVELSYWLGRAQHALGMRGASAKSLEALSVPSKD